MTRRILLIEPGDEATRRNLLDGIYQTQNVELVIASAVYESSHQQWFEPYTKHFISFNFSDIDKLIEEAKKIDINGVITYFDFCLEAVNQISNALDLALTFKGTETIARKDEQRRILSENGIRSVRYVVIKPNETPNIEKKLEFISLPCVVKPTQFTSSLGVRICSSLEEVEQAVDIARRCDFWDEKVRSLIPNVSQDVIIEEKIEGNEISVEGYSFQGTYQIIGITKKIRSKNVKLDELGHVFPHPEIPLDSEIGRKITDYTIKVHSALGILNSVTHTEIILTDGNSEPILVELNCRPAGGCIPLLVKKSTGQNIPEIMLNLSIGNRPKLPIERTMNTHSALFVYSSIEGRLRESPVSHLDLSKTSGTEVRLLKQRGDFLYRAGVNEVSRCALIIKPGKHEALPELTDNIIDPFLDVFESDNRTIGLFWAKSDDLFDLIDVERTVWGELGASDDCIKKRLIANERSTVLAKDLHNGQCLGFLTHVPIPMEFEPPRKSWSELAVLAHDPNHFSTLHQYRKLISFGVSIACLQAAPHGLATALFKTLAKQLSALGCESFVGGIRMIGLRKHLDTGGSIETYLQAIRFGNLYNPIYGAIIEAGGDVHEPLPEYYSDYESNNFGLKVKISSKNPSGVSR